MSKSIAVFDIVLFCIWVYSSCILYIFIIYIMIFFVFFLSDDHSRVVLSNATNVSGSDYINASTIVSTGPLTTLRPRQNGRHVPDDIFKCIFLNENIWISIKISLKFVPKGPINNITALVQIIAWHWPGNKPLSQPMMVRLLMHMRH